VALNGEAESQTPAAEAVVAIRASGGQTIASGHDVSDWAAGELIQLAIDTFGRLDVLINNAGIFPVKSTC